MGKPIDGLSVGGLALAEAGGFAALVGWLFPCTEFLYHPTIALPDCVTTHALGDLGIGLLASGVILLIAGRLPQPSLAPDLVGPSPEPPRSVGLSRWRRRAPIRAYLTASGTLLIVATYMIVGLWFLGASSWRCAGCGLNPIAQSLVLGGPVETYGIEPAIPACVASPCHVYSFSVVVRNNAFEVGNVALEILNQTGVFQIIWEASFVDIAGDLIGSSSYDQTWLPTSVASVNLVSGDSLVIFTVTGVSSSLSGDRLVGYGQGPFSGTLAVAIP